MKAFGAYDWLDAYGNPSNATATPIMEEPLQYQDFPEYDPRSIGMLSASGVGNLPAGTNITDVQNIKSYEDLKTYLAASRSYTLPTWGWVAIGLGILWLTKK